MEKTYSPHWKRSTQRRKQRKYVHNAPLHARTKMMSSTLAKDLRKKHGKRSMQIRKGDRVKILRGNHKGTSSTVERVDLRAYRVFLADVEVTRKDGTKNKLAIHPSNLMITDLKAEDKYRKEALDRTKAKSKPETKSETKGKDKETKNKTE